MLTRIKVRNAPREMVYDGEIGLSKYPWRYNHYTGEVLCHIGGKLTDVCEFLGVKRVECMLDLIGVEAIVKVRGPRTSSRCGVFYDQRARKWRASGGRDDPRPYFDTEGEAEEFRDQWEIGQTALKEHIDVEKSNKLKILDLFCCAGGAATGYMQAGFEVTGVDIKPQPNYPFPFIQTDALTLDPEFMASFDAIHASPPCQSYSGLAGRNGNADEWPRLIEPVRSMLVDSELPYIIENVSGAPLRYPVVLCGTMFPGLRVLRHRLFESNFTIVPPKHNEHPRVHTLDRRKSHFGKTDEWKDFVQVTGGGNCTLAAARDAMGIDWMTKKEINESIPPAYTKLIGKQLILHLSDLRRRLPL